MTDIFISYAHEDQPFVRRMVPALEAEGFSVWWDHTIPPGKSWDTFIAKGIAEARCCIVVWSPHSIGSDWVKEEATLGKDASKLLPVTIDGVEPPVGFRRIQAANLHGWNGDRGNPQWLLLVREARSLVGGARTSPAVARPSPSHAPAPSKLPRALIGGGIAVAAALIAAVVLMPRPQGNPAPSTAIEEPAIAIDAPAPAADPAPGPDTSAEELENLRRERDRAVEQSQAQEAENPRLREEQRLRAELQRTAQPTAAISPVGTWRGELRWSSMDPMVSDFIIESNGTARSGYGEGGTWQISGSRITIQLQGRDANNSDNSAIFVGTISDNRIYGTMSTTASSHTGTFDVQRQ